MQKHELSPRTASATNGQEFGSIPRGFLERTFKCEEYIFHAGHQANTLPYLLQGQVELTGPSIDKSLDREAYVAKIQVF